MRLQSSRELIQRLFNLGVINSCNSLLDCKNIGASAFCRRRLSVVLIRLWMVQTLKQSVSLIEQGHIRIGPETVTDPSFLVTRTMEDFITWTDESKIKKHIKT